MFTHTLKLTDFINQNEKFISGCWKVTFNVFILKANSKLKLLPKSFWQDLSDNNKLMSYKLSNGNYLLLNFSYPIYKYHVNISYKGKGIKIRNRSKAYLEVIRGYLSSLEVNTPQVYLTQLKTNSKAISAFDSFPDGTIILSWGLTTKGVKELLNSFDSTLTYTALAKPSPEVKKPRSRGVIKKETISLLTKISQFLEIENTSFSDELLKTLINTRLSSNPIILNKEL